MTLHADVDQDVCISSGQCVADAPNGFEFDDDEIATAVEGGRSLGDERLKVIARNCPSGAIRLLDANNEIVPD